MRSAILFLNGEYWGLYTITENISEETFSRHYNIPKKQIAILKESSVENGEQEDLDSFVNFASLYSKRDLQNKNNYNEVGKAFDIDSMIEHYISYMFFSACDWPNNNYGVWKSKETDIKESPYNDGKWRFISYDFDYTLGNSYDKNFHDDFYKYNDFQRVDAKKNEFPTNLFVSLLKNEEFKNKFISVFGDFVNEVAKYERMEKLLDEYKKNYTEIIANSLTRWSTNDYRGDQLSTYAWNKNNYEKKVINDLKIFLKERPNFILGHLKSYFQLKGELCQINIAKKGDGMINISSIMPTFNDGKWSGKYFANIPFNVTAIPGEKSTFKGWTGDIDSKNTIVTVTLEKSINIQAIFEKSE